MNWNKSLAKFPTARRIKHMVYLKNIKVLRGVNETSMMLFFCQMFQSPDNQSGGMTLVKEITDRIMDLVSKRNANSSIIGAIAEVRVQRRQSRSPNGELQKICLWWIRVKFILKFGNSNRNSQRPFITFFICSISGVVTWRPLLSPPTRPPGALAGLRGDRHLGVVGGFDVAMGLEKAQEAERPHCGQHPGLVIFGSHNGENNALHNSVSAARDQLNHIKNVIEENPPNHHQHLLLLHHHHLHKDQNAINTKTRKSDTGSQSGNDKVDKRLQKGRFPRAPPAFLLVDWEECPPNLPTGSKLWTNKQDNRQLQSQSASRAEFIV